MPNRSINQNDRNESIDDSAIDTGNGQFPEQVLSTRLKVTFSLLFGVPAVLALALLLYEVLEEHAKPSELHPDAVLIFCLTGLAVVLVPWGRLGLRLKKIGPVEFEQIITRQKEEQSESLTFLQNQIDELKNAVRLETGIAIQSETVPQTPSIALPALLDKFMRNYLGTFFSPLRIKTWGSKQAGFADFGLFSKEEITQTLLEMLASNRVRTIISRRGNTLYGIGH